MTRSLVFCRRPKPPEQPKLCNAIVLGNDGHRDAGRIGLISLQEQIVFARTSKLKTFRECFLQENIFS